MQRSDAETLALKGLSWLAGDPETLLRFLDVSGLEPDDLRGRAGDPELLAAVLDYLLADDALMTGLCAGEGIKTEDVHKARTLLPGATRD